MAFLHLLAYGATALSFCFVVFSLACGLYYLAELIEEYTVYTRKVIKAVTMAVAAIHILLFIFDRLPFLPLAFSLICHGVYSLNLQSFPFISLSGMPFISSCILVFVDHFVWFKYFSHNYLPFMDIAAFFGICVWLVPFIYFVSLSANDNALPLSDTSAADTIPHQHKTSLLKNLLSFVGIKKDEPNVFAAPTSYPAEQRPSTAYSGGVHHRKAT